MELQRMLVSEGNVNFTLFSVFSFLAGRERESEGGGKREREGWREKEGEKGKAEDRKSVV